MKRGPTLAPLKLPDQAAVDKVAPDEAPAAAAAAPGPAPTTPAASPISTASIFGPLSPKSPGGESSDDDGGGGGGLV